MTLTTDPRETIFHSLTPMINEQCRRFSACYGFDFSDLQSHAHEAFLMALASHEQERGAITTHVHNRINYRLLDYRRGHKRKQKRFPIPSLWMDNEQSEGPTARRNWSLRSFLAELSPDANTAIRLVLRQDRGEHDADNTDALAPSRRMRLVRSLRRIGWNRERIVAVFTEIREALA